jgi:hypothetical protein
VGGNLFDPCWGQGRGKTEKIGIRKGISWESLVEASPWVRKQLPGISTT